MSSFERRVRELEGSGKPGYCPKCKPGSTIVVMVWDKAAEEVDETKPRCPQCGRSLSGDGSIRVIVVVDDM